MSQFTARKLDSETAERMSRAYPVYREVQLARFGDSGYLMPSDMEPFLREYYSTPADKGDIWIVTLPKCGTTWVQEMVWLIMNDCKYETAKCLLSPDRYHFLEIGGITASHMRERIKHGNNPISKKLHFDSLRDRPKPWFVKTHLPLQFCPPDLLKNSKVIYVARNPKDTCISYFNHLKLFGERDPQMPLSEFVDLFIRGEVSQLPFFDHILEAWRLRHHPNLLFLFFEDLKRDLRGNIVKVAEFLGKCLNSEQLDGLEKHLTFDSMKKNEWVNKKMMFAYSPLSAEELIRNQKESDDCQFMRKGETGDWKNHLSEEMSQKMDEWSGAQLKNTDLSFPK